MNNIENTYISYEELVEEVGEKVIENRIKQISQEMLDFMHAYSIEDVAYIHEMALTHAVMDYFSDIQRLKKYQGIDHINDIKIKAYETFWLLQRKPLQLKVQLEEDRSLYVNEKFIMTRLTSFMLAEEINSPILGDNKMAYTNFLNTLYYYLKFRRCDAQSIELMLLAFNAGKFFSK